MNKKLIAIVGAAVLTFAMGTTAFAATSEMGTASTAIRTQSTQRQSQNGCGGSGMMSGRGMMSGGYGLMMDENGNFLSQENFDAKLDKAVQDGTIKAEDKDFYRNMYENCISGNTTQGGCGSL